MELYDCTKINTHFSFCTYIKNNYLHETIQSPVSTLKYKGCSKYEIKSVYQ
jgi:hypothetical protein